MEFEFKYVSLENDSVKTLERDIPILTLDRDTARNNVPLTKLVQTSLSRGRANASYLGI